MCFFERCSRAMVTFESQSRLSRMKANALGSPVDPYSSSVERLCSGLEYSRLSTWATKSHKPKREGFRVSIPFTRKSPISLEDGNEYGEHGAKEVATNASAVGTRNKDVPTTMEMDANRTESRGCTGFTSGRRLVSESSININSPDQPPNFTDLLVRQSRGTINAGIPDRQLLTASAQPSQRAFRCPASENDVPDLCRVLSHRCHCHHSEAANGSDTCRR
jgi:hypothetical protein